MKTTKSRIFSAAVAVLLVAAVMLACVPALNGISAKAEETAASDGGLEIAVMSDVHILPPDLIADTDDYADALNSDRKMFTESTAILDRMLAEVKKESPDVLMISGDLTKDGEYEGHLYLAEKLEALKTELPELKIYVTNGNHDVNNTLAFDYSTQSGEKEQATLTSPEKFIEAYDVVYGDESVIARFEPAEDKTAGMLSYAARPADGYTVIVVDSCKYSADNTESGEDEHETGGAISADLLAWIEDQAEAAKERGDVVIGMQHHGLIEHFDMEEEILGDYLVDDYRTVSQTYADAGLSAVFTGHMHANDIAYMKTEAGNELYDIETGSAVTYPCPMRFVEVTRSEADNAVKTDLDVRTVTNLDGITYTTADKRTETIDDLTEYAKGFGITEGLVENIGTDLVLSLASGLGSSAAAAGGLENMLVSLAADLVGVNVGSLSQLVNLVAAMITTDTSESLYYDGAGHLVLSMMGQNLTISVTGLAESLSYLCGELDKVLASADTLAEPVNKFISDVLDIVVYDDESEANDDKTLIELVNDVYQSHLSGADGDGTAPAYIAEVLAGIADGTFTDKLLTELFDKLWEFVIAVSDDIPLRDFLGIERFDVITDGSKIAYDPQPLDGRTQPLITLNADGTSGLFNLLLTLGGFNKYIDDTHKEDAEDPYVTILEGAENASLADLLDMNIILAGGKIVRNAVEELVFGTPADGDAPAEEGLITSELKAQLGGLLSSIVSSMSSDGGYKNDNEAEITVSYERAEEETPAPAPTDPEDPGEPSDESGCGSVAAGGTAAVMICLCVLLVAVVAVTAAVRAKKRGR